MGADKPNEHDTQRGVLDLYDQPIRVALDVKYGPVACQKIGSSEYSPDVCWPAPTGLRSEREPKPERFLGVRMLLPEGDKGTPIEDTQLSQNTMLPFWEQPVMMVTDA